MQLLLTHGYFLEEDPKEREIMKPYAPLGLLHLSSHLRARGFDVEIYDSTFGSRAELLQTIERERPAMVGIYGNLMTRRNVLEIAAHAKASGCRVVLGGPEPANYPNEYFDAGADAIVNGEGEVSLEALLRARDVTADFASVPGIQYRCGDRVARTQAAPLIANLDAQPWPDRERIDLSKYLNAWRSRHGRGSISVITARGCPYHCRWCSHSVYGKTHRRRSPGSVAEEIAWIRERYDPEMLWMADDVFTIHPGWILQFVEEMKRRDLRIPFECITRADRMNERMAEALAALGCFRVWIGSESGSQRILDAMQRGVKVEQVREAVRVLRERAIETGMFLMWGYDGEEMVDIEATVEHVKVCRPDVFLTTVSYPIKGTPYYEDVAERVVRIGEWSGSTDREVKIRGRHSRRFYQFADQLLKSEVAGEVVAANAARRGLRETFDEVEVA
ncbi:MAG TPA: radical SAM protein [Bryobacteraceae bacterium]|nr:radical SAM protein [Bryobacteraceae bacterium]